MKKLFKAIMSFFVKDNYSCYTKSVNKENMIYSVINSQVRLANIKYDNHLFSVIPTKNNIVIKCQTDCNVYSTSILSLIYCGMFSREELTYYINKELKILVNDTNSILNCYKANKNEKDN